MSVHTTSDKNILRVIFQVEGEIEKGDYISEIVCFLRICDAGLETYYSHHLIRSRDSNVGPFTHETTRRMYLTPVLRAVIAQGVAHEFFSAFAQDIRTSPAERNRLPTDVQVLR